MGLSVLPPCTPYTVGKTPFLAVTRKAPSKAPFSVASGKKKKGLAMDGREGGQVSWKDDSSQVDLQGQSYRLGRTVWPPTS